MVSPSYQRKIPKPQCHTSHLPNRSILPFLSDWQGLRHLMKLPLMESSPLRIPWAPASTWCLCHLTRLDCPVCTSGHSCRCLLRLTWVLFTNLVTSAEGILGFSEFPGEEHSHCFSCLSSLHIKWVSFSRRKHPIFKFQLHENPVPEPSWDPCLSLSESLRQYLGTNNECRKIQMSTLLASEDRHSSEKVTLSWMLPWAVPQVQVLPQA